MGAYPPSWHGRYSGLVTWVGAQTGLRGSGSTVRACRSFPISSGGYFAPGWSEYTAAPPRSSAPAELSITIIDHHSKANQLCGQLCYA